MRLIFAIIFCFFLSFSSSAHAFSLALPQAAKQGQAVLAHVESQNDLANLQFHWLERVFPLKLHKDAASNLYKAMFLLPIPTDAPKDLIFSLYSKQELLIEQGIEIIEVTWPLHEIKVEKKYVSPPSEVLAQIEKDRQLVRKVLANFDLSRAWQHFKQPLASLEVTSEFGGKRVFNKQPRSQHKGVDLRAPSGTEVFALAAGKVVIAKALYFSGQVVYVDHGQGFVSSYAHLSAISVKPGQSIEAGQVIGKSGATGRVSGPHLHLGVHILGVAVDALSLFR